MHTSTNHCPTQLCLSYASLPAANYGWLPAVGSSSLLSTWHTAMWPTLYFGSHPNQSITSFPAMLTASVHDLKSTQPVEGGDQRGAPRYSQIPSPPSTFHKNSQTMSLELLPVQQLRWIPALHGLRVPLQADSLCCDLHFPHTPKEIGYQDMFRVALKEVSTVSRSRYTETFGTNLKLKIITVSVIVKSTHTNNFD